MPGHNDWTEKALSDLMLAMKSIGDDQTMSSAVFLSHQCAEKALKGYLMFASQAIPRVHDLEIVLNECVRLNKEFLLLSKICILLNPYGFNSRYPNDAFYMDQQILATLIEMATKIFHFVENVKSMKL